MENISPAMKFNDISFYDAPDDIEGSPYWVDLWGSVNGYRIGLQIKPKTYKAASISIYTGKARSSQNKGHKLFQDRYGGKVLVATPKKGELDQRTYDDLQNEIYRLSNLPRGPHSELP